MDIFVIVQFRMECEYINLPRVLLIQWTFKEVIANDVMKGIRSNM